MEVWVEVWVAIEHNCNPHDVIQIKPTLHLLPRVPVSHFTSCNASRLKVRLSLHIEGEAKSAH